MTFNEGDIVIHEATGIRYRWSYGYSYFGNGWGWQELPTCAELRDRIEYDLQFIAACGGATPEQVAEIRGELDECSEESEENRQSLTGLWDSVYRRASEAYLAWEQKNAAEEEEE